MYFIPTEGLDLKDTPFKVHPMVLDEVKGIAIANRHINEWCKINNVIITDTVEYREHICASIESTVSMSPDLLSPPPPPPPSPPTCSIEGSWNGDLKSKVSELFKQFTKKTGKNIKIIYQSGISCQPVEDGGYYIFVHSHRGRGENINTFLNHQPQVTPSYIFGMNREYLKGDLLANDTNMDDVFISPEGCVLGYVWHQNVYLTYNLANNLNQLPIWKALYEFLLSYNNKETNIKDVACEILSANKSETARLEERRSLLETSYQNYLDKCIEITRELNTIQTSISRLSNPNTDFTALIETELKEIQSLSKIVSVVVRHGRFLIETDTLYCTDSRTNEVHKIGKFLIILNPKDKYFIRWFNLTQRINSYAELIMNAPHVFLDGYGCLGSMAEYLPQLIKENKLCNIVELAIQFIETANVEDRAGKGINLFPIKETS